MALSKVVARFKDGGVLKGYTKDFSPVRKDFHLEPLSGEKANIVETELLKALFFVKDFAGNGDRRDVYNDVISGAGRKVLVTFKDGELIIGFSQGYSPDRLGFFMIPADMKNNNERIFIVNSATENVTFL